MFFFLIWDNTVLLVWLYYLRYLCSLYQGLAWWWPQVFQPKRVSSCTTAAVMCNMQVQTLTTCCTLNCWQRFQTGDLCSGVRFSHARGIVFCTVSMPNVRLTNPLGDQSVLHSVHAYCEAQQIFWRSVCSAQCQCLLWGSPNILEICLFCTVSMPTVRLTNLLGDLSVLHNVHVYCEAHQTFWRSVCSAQCPCLLWDSPDVLEICLFCTMSMPTVRLTKHFGDLSVLHSVHAYCETHQTS